LAARSEGRPRRPHSPADAEQLASVELPRCVLATSPPLLAISARFQLATDRSSPPHDGTRRHPSGLSATAAKATLWGPAAVAVGSAPGSLPGRGVAGCCASGVDGPYVDEVRDPLPPVATCSVGPAQGVRDRQHRIAVGATVVVGEWLLRGAGSEHCCDGGGRGHARPGAGCRGSRL
jgi:hypothetical protein